MEKRLIWIWYGIKQQIKRKTFWLQMTAMIFLAWLVQAVVLPDNANTRVVLVNEDDGFGKELVSQLEAAEGVFFFEEVADEETLRRQIISGKAECGLVIRKGLGERMLAGDTKGMIRMYCSKAGAKEPLVRERVYREFFRCYSDILLGNLGKEIFPEKGRQDAVEYMLMRNCWYQSGNGVFDVVYEEIEAADIKNTEKGKAWPLRGIVAAFIFLYMLLWKGEEISGRSKSYTDSLTKRERRAYLFWTLISVSLLPALAGILLCLCGGEGTNFFLESGKMLLFLLYSGVWVTAVGKILPREQIYNGWICPLFAVNLLLPPVFWDLSRYVPALDGISWVLPVGFYLLFVIA